MRQTNKQKKKPPKNMFAASKVFVDYGTHLWIVFFGLKIQLR